MPAPVVLVQPNQILNTPKPAYPNLLMPFNQDLRAIYAVAITGAFTRPSVAYKQDGTQVASGVPRFEPGKFAQAVMVEEGTTNLLTANQSSVETDTTGLKAFGTGVTISRDTTEKWQGTASLKVVTPGTEALEGFYTSPGVSVEANLTYTGSVWLKGSGTVRVYLRDEANGNGTTVTVTLTSTWQRVTATFTMLTGATTAALYVRTDTAQAVTFYADGLQIEQKPYATSWTLGGSTRSPETLAVPTAGVFVKGNWTKEFYFNPTSTQVVSGKTGYLWECYIDTNNYYALKVGPDGKSYLEVESGGTIYQTATTSAPVLAVGTLYAFAIKGNGSQMALLVNGSNISKVSYAEPVGNLPTHMYLGCDHNGANHANGLYDDLRISSRARTDADIMDTYKTGEV